MVASTPVTPLFPLRPPRARGVYIWGAELAAASPGCSPSEQVEGIVLLLEFSLRLFCRLTGGGGSHRSNGQVMIRAFRVISDQREQSQPRSRAPCSCSHPFLSPRAISAARWGAYTPLTAGWGPLNPSPLGSRCLGSCGRFCSCNRGANVSFTSEFRAPGTQCSEAPR